jgi:hypothetical protein
VLLSPSLRSAGPLMLGDPLRRVWATPPVSENRGGIVPPLIASGPDSRQLPLKRRGLSAERGCARSPQRRKVLLYVRSRHSNPGH